MGFRDAFNEIASVGNQLVLRSKERKSYKPAPDSATLFNYRVELLNRYSEIASFFHFTLPLADSAIYWYRYSIKICGEQEKGFPDSLARVVSRLKETCLFSLSDVYRSQNNAVLQDSLFKILLELYPRGKYSNRIRSFYNLPLLSLFKPDEVLYTQAIQATNSGDATRAFQFLDSLKTIFPQSGLMPKALLARAFLFETALRNRDSALSEYKLLASRFPESPEFNSVSEKLKIWETFLNQADSGKSVKRSSVDSAKATAPTSAIDSAKASALPKGENSLNPPSSPLPAIPLDAPKVPTKNPADSIRSKPLFQLPPEPSAKTKPPMGQNPKK